MTKHTSPKKEVWSHPRTDPRVVFFGAQKPFATAVVHQATAGTKYTTQVSDMSFDEFLDLTAEVGPLSSRHFDLAKAATAAALREQRLA